jgi:Zn-dependent alcohol dehydrogenase
MDVRAAIARGAQAKLTIETVQLEINEAFDLMHAGESIRTVVTY